MSREKISRNDPCPCGSGKKFKNCCYGKPATNVRGSASGQQQQEEQSEYPIGTLALYGPNDKVTTKMVAGVIFRRNGEPILQRWVATDVTTNPKIRQEMLDFFRDYEVKRIAKCTGNIGCPHEEGIDFPVGEDCPFCPFWKGKQGSARRD